MPTTAAFAATAALVGDPARAGMLCALMDGRALTATELARVAGVTPQTASGHLAQLTAAGMLAMERQGRHRYHRLASPAVAAMLESIMAASTGLRDAVAPARPAAARDEALRRARTCYDHLAGRVAVGMAQSMADRGHCEFGPDGAAMTPGGLAFLRDLGVVLEADGAPARRRARVFCRPCLDWTERKPHIAGRVGAALCEACFAQGWMRRLPGTRALDVTPAGRRALARAFGVEA
ncbi:ArsR/SmtB family transcription factor [Alsobacter sp. SYSU BS001988]